MTSSVERARVIASGVAARYAGSVDTEGRFPDEAFAALKDARLLSLFVPKPLGGEGASVSEIASICHLLGQNCGSTGLIYAMHQIQTACIVLHGQDIAWQRDWLRRLTVEQLLLASATTEAATGGDLGRSDCAILKDGDRFAVEKQGAVISYGEHADGILVTARRTADAPASDQILAIIPRQQFSLETTARWDAMGMRGTCSNTYVFRGEGHVDQILPCPYGDIQSNTMAPFSHLTWASVWLGIATDAVSRARRYLRSKAGGMTGYSPGLGRLVNATAMLQQLKSTIVSALRSYEAVLASSDHTVTLGLLVTINNVKISVATGVIQIIQEAMMICGIAGYRNDSEFSVARHLRDAHSAALMVGNDRIAAGMGKMLLMQRVDTDLLAPGDSR
jgi:acyl-CoA dehydrogenase